MIPLFACSKFLCCAPIKGVPLKRQLLKKHVMKLVGYIALLSVVVSGLDWLLEDTEILF